MDEDYSNYCTVAQVALKAGVAPSTVLRWYKDSAYATLVPDGAEPWYRRGQGKTAKVYLHPELAKRIVDAYSAPWRMNRCNEKGTT